MNTSDPEDAQLAKVLNFPVKAGDVVDADEDQESVVIEPPALGAPVDPTDQPRRPRRRRPILPNSLRSRNDAICPTQIPLIPPSAFIKASAARP